MERRRCSSCIPGLGAFTGLLIIWFTALFPYLILLVLFGRGVTLEGASTGLLYFITPKWEKLLEPMVGTLWLFDISLLYNVWVSAGTQVLFSYGIGIGANVALGSYNRYHHNFYRDSMIVCLISSGTSLFSGLVIFSVLGHMSFLQNKPIGEVARSVQPHQRVQWQANLALKEMAASDMRNRHHVQPPPNMEYKRCSSCIPGLGVLTGYYQPGQLSPGPGLAFLAYPEVVVTLPFSPIWSVLFFLMLVLLGTDSQVCLSLMFVLTPLCPRFTVVSPHCVLSLCPHLTVSSPHCVLTSLCPHLTV
ncbi:SLC6A1 [Cordylochernes scorpioides]|uniref:SLC6A1 n=1 Tax=Cordylochernes scorpioides TaxID=51811 RepID=A0ABY6JZ34_9ARAC|nr:SLC6A1 [Cordylochernes scorpioides]